MAEIHWNDGDVQDPPFDAQERRALCDLFEELGADVPTLLNGWTANDLATHLVLRERDLIAALGRRSDRRWLERWLGAVGRSMCVWRMCLGQEAPA
jgi:hypothetical protein